MVTGSSTIEIFWMFLTKICEFLLFLTSMAVLLSAEKQEAITRWGFLAIIFLLIFLK